MYDSIWQRQVFLGQAEPATSLTRAQDTVNLGSPVLPKVLVGGVLLGVLYYTVKSMQGTTRGFGPDAIDELTEESRRIQRRNALRRSHAR